LDIRVYWKPLDAMVEWLAELEESALLFGEKG